MTMNEDALRKAFKDLRDRVAYLESASGLFASDSDLDSQYGDEQIRFSPKSFRGPDYTGKRMSQCSPEFLEALAEAMTYAANNPKPDKLKYVAGNRRSAARARGWSRRLRAGVVPPPPDARALAGELPSAPAAPTFEAPAFEAPSFDDYSDADEEIPGF
jgi:hypothetical protein